VDSRLRSDRPASQLRSELEATAALVFAQTPPEGLEFAMDHSRSYAEWLHRRPGTERDTDA